MTCNRCQSAIQDGATRCRYCQADIGRRSLGRLVLDVMRHPVFVLGVATLVSLPQISKALTRAQAQEDARVRKGLDSVVAAFQVEKDLNAVTTLFYAFGRDFAMSRLTPEQYSSAQHDLREAIVQAWVAFDRDAWWWADQLRLETSLVRALNAPQRDTFQQLTSAYKDNLLRTTGQVDRLWTHFLRRPKQPTWTETESIRADTWNCLTKLGEQRRHLATRIASFFEQPTASDLTSVQLAKGVCSLDSPFDVGAAAP